MARYAVHFVFDTPVETPPEPRYQLAGDTLEAAKIEAAILYATAKFGSLPAADAILQKGAAEVYRYPEAAATP
ncbi:hypothetical protein [Phenylobacterium sp.]|uniref:hypothetical protein n=1 Tax=Phenylobacterium sp. TaxID=1871053 RepID=UPI0025D51E65|nr:hypothetical protein [Phenylobacterium sp.]